MPRNGNGKSFVIDHPHNEASALIEIHNQRLLEEQGWEEGFWIVSDEKEAPDAVAALGRPGGRQGSKWQVLPLKCKLGKGSDDQTTDDAEAMARAGSWIYVFGSQFGSKDGPLDPERHFVGRFNEATVRCSGGKLKGQMDLVRPVFCLHRLINDAFGQWKTKLIAAREVDREYIQRSIEQTKSKWRDRLREGDYPINVEGATFLPSGRLLLGLRYPVSAGGQPLMVEIDGIDRLFEGKAGRPQVTRILVVQNIGSKQRPKGIRELDQRGRTIHLISGDLDSDPQRSQILEDHPRGEHAVSEHHRFVYPTDERGGVRAEEVRRFTDEANVEGLALGERGRIWYVHDDEQIRLEVAEDRDVAKKS